MLSCLQVADWRKKVAADMRVGSMTQCVLHAVKLSSELRGEARHAPQVWSFALHSCAPVMLQLPPVALDAATSPVVST